MYDIKEEEEKVILIGVSTQSDNDTLESLDELEELVETAGAVTVAKIVQNREKIHNTTYIGKGKIEEVARLLTELDATGIVCDDELTPVQIKNLEDALDTKIMDRTLVILDIFAKRAVTSEGKIQVELAQLKYRATRLIGLGHVMSRLGGGIGTRGPGEKKLEKDRRLINERIAQLRHEVVEVKNHRELVRKQREKKPTPVVAIVGYTNAGKSTLLNALTESSVLEEDKLFATLDPTTRNLKLSSGQEIMLTDTVGFIRKLPHHLIDAFRSTLEEAKYADLILHVVDSSSPHMDTHIHVVYETLDNLGVKDKKIITLFHKQDKLEDETILKDLRADYIVNTSVKTGQGLEQLLEMIEKVLRENNILIQKLYHFSEAGKIGLIRKYGQLQIEEYRDDGIYVKAYIPAELEGRV